MLLPEWPFLNALPLPLVHYLMINNLSHNPFTIRHHNALHSKIRRILSKETEETVSHPARKLPIGIRLETTPSETKEDILKHVKIIGDSEAPVFCVHPQMVSRDSVPNLIFNRE